MAGIERVPLHIPGVVVEGDFPIKRFVDAICNGAARQYGVKVDVTLRLDEEEHNG